MSTHARQTDGQGTGSDAPSLTPRGFLAAVPAALAAPRARLLIDTHLEVWTRDPRFPFRHPERPAAAPEVSAPIENQVAQMRDYGLTYTVLINPRFYGWDNSYISSCL